MGQWKAFKKSSGTGWKELEHEAGSGWKALLWDEIDVGAVAESGDTYLTADGRTVVCFTNPANASGTLDKLDVYIRNVGNGELRVGIVYLVSGTTYKCRSAQDITGLSAGLNSNVAVNLAVVTGDFIATYTPTNDAEIELDHLANASRYYSGNALVVDSQYNYATSFSYELKAYLSNY